MFDARVYVDQDAKPIAYIQDAKASPDTPIMQIVWGFYTESQFRIQFENVAQWQEAQELFGVTELIDNREE